MALVTSESFTSHSGRLLPFKIECDALSGASILSFARIIASRVQFSSVEGVPNGGLRLASALRLHAGRRGGLLIVDDVLTTGASMEEQRAGREAKGVVLFARGECPPWVQPVFVLGETWR